ncbi:MAG: hypothetical protein ACFFCM_07510 [Promethearchaeota archaeon]
MHLIHKLEVGEDCPENVVSSESNQEAFIKRLKEITARRLELRPQDTQEVIFNATSGKK